MEKTFFSHGHNPGKSQQAKFGGNTKSRQSEILSSEIGDQFQIVFAKQASITPATEYYMSFRPPSRNPYARLTWIPAFAGMTLAGELISCLFAALIVSSLANNRFVWLQATVIDNQNKKRKEYI